MRLLLIIFTIALSLIGWAQTDRKIVPGDKLKVTVAEEKTLNKTYTVTDDGKILVDFVGIVEVQNLTAPEAEQRLAGKLTQFGIVKKATVKVEIVGATTTPPTTTGGGGAGTTGGGTTGPPPSTIRVSGEAQNKDAITFKSGMRLSDVIRVSQPTSSADLTKIEVRSVDGTKTPVDFSRFDPATNAQNPTLRAGDEVFFPLMGGSEPTTGGGGATTGGNPTTGGGNPTTGGGNPTTGGGGEPVKPPLTGPVFVLGGVNKPGQFAYSEGMTVRKAIEAAGGFSVRGDAARVRLERAGAAAQVYDLSVPATDAEVRPQDQIVVEVVTQRRYLQVNGAVRSGGLVEFTDGMTLGQAVQKAGGLMPHARPKEVVIKRQGTGDKPEIIKVNYEDIMKGYRGEPTLKPGDVVEVPGKKGGINRQTQFLIGAAIIFFLFR